MREFKHSHLDVNEHLNKIELKEALKEEKMDTMRCDVSEMKNVCTTNLFVDVSNLPIII